MRADRAFSPCKPIVVELHAFTLCQPCCGVCMLEAPPLYAPPLWVAPCGSDRLLCPDCMRSGEAGIRRTLTVRAAEAADLAAGLLRHATESPWDDLATAVMVFDRERWPGRGTVLLWRGDPAERDSGELPFWPDWAADEDAALRFCVQEMARSLASEAAELLYLAEFTWRLPEWSAYARAEAKNWRLAELEEAAG